MVNQRLDCTCGVRGRGSVVNQRLDSVHVESEVEGLW